jgi:hypothetical protein
MGRGQGVKRALTVHHMGANGIECMLKFKGWAHMN